MKICKNCGSEFQSNSNRHYYCSDECKKEVKNNRRNKYSRSELEKDNSRKCVVCNKEFEITPKLFKKIYCSEDCSNKAERIFGNKRETDLNYKDRIRFGGNKYKVLERDNYECQICGNKLKLVIHHLDHSGQTDTTNNEMSNLITLCRRCHINIHKIGGQI